MKSYFFLLAGASLSLASCSQEKTTETTTTPTDTTATTTTTTTTAETDAMIQARAQRIADKMVADMKITDEAMKAKIRTAYVNRGMRMRDMRAKYTTDTTGQASAMRDADMETDTEFKSIYTDPTQYQSYQSSRSTYDEKNYMDDDASAASTDASSMAPPASDNTMSSNSDASMDASNGGAMVEKSKSKMTDGSKVKVKDDGTVKMKDADGDKTKIK